MKNLFLLILLFSISCTTNIHRYAETDYNEASETIVQLHKNAILWVYDTEYKKEAIIKEMISKNPDKSTLKNSLTTLQDRQIEKYDQLISAINQYYHFNEVYLIPDSLYSKFIESKVHATNLKNEKFMKDDIAYIGINCISPSDDKIFIKKGVTPISAPFPSVIQRPNDLILSIFSGNNHYNNLVKKLNSELTKYHQQVILDKNIKSEY